MWWLHELRLLLLSRALRHAELRSRTLHRLGQARGRLLPLRRSLDGLKQVPLSALALLLHRLLELLEER